MLTLPMPPSPFNGNQFSQELLDDHSIDIIGLISTKNGQIRFEGEYTAQEQQTIQNALNSFTHDPLFDSAPMITDRISNPVRMLAPPTQGG